MDRVGDLGPQPLLDLRSTSEGVDRSSDLAEADDLVGSRLVGDVGTAVEGEEVVFTEARELDVAHHDQIALAPFVVEDLREVLGRVLIETLDHFAEGLGDPARRILDSFAVGVLPETDQDLADGRFDPWGVENFGGERGRLGLGKNVREAGLRGHGEISVDAQAASATALEVSARIRSRTKRRIHSGSIWKRWQIGTKERK